MACLNPGLVSPADEEAAAVSAADADCDDDTDGIESVRYQWKPTTPASHTVEGDEVESLEVVR